GRNLDALALAPEPAAQRPHQQRLAQPRRALQQDVTAGEHGDQRLLDEILLADHGARDLGADTINLFFEREYVHQPLLSWWSSAVLRGHGALPSLLRSSL